MGFNSGFKGLNRILVMPGGFEEDAWT